MRSLRLSPLLWTTLTALISFVLGYIGYRSSPDWEMNRVDTVYRSMQLFVMDSEIAPGSPWPLMVARFLAPLSLATAAVVTVAAFLRDQTERIMIRLFVRNHVVVIGLSEANGSVAESLCDSGKQVVVIEANPSHLRLPGLRAAGARVVIGDGRQPVTLRRACVDRARHIVVTTGRDATNLDIADQVRTVRAEGPRHHATVHVAIADPELWLELGRLTFGRSTSGTSVECFNRADRIANQLVQVAAGAGPLDRVAVIGDGPSATRVIAHIVRRGLIIGRAPVITFEPTADVPIVIVCRTDGGLAEGLHIARSYVDSRVIVAVDTDTPYTLIDLLGDTEDRVRLVSATSSSVALGLLKSSGIEVMARAKHDDYLEQERAKGLTAADNPSLVPWDDLPQSLQDSNRRFAASVAETLELAGVTIEPLRDGAVPAFDLSDAALEALAIREHDRWAADLRTDGWTFAPGRKDPETKTHPMLVSWDQLSDDEREKDRDAIRAIPRMLARVGYKLVVRAT